MYENNAVYSQFEYILINSLSSSSLSDSYDSYLVDNGAFGNFSGYKEVLSNLVERETSLKVILGDNTTYPMKGFGTVNWTMENMLFFMKRCMLHN